MNPGNTELTEINGIGKKTAESLKSELDIEYAEDLLDFTEDDLKEVEGIGPSRSRKIVKGVIDLIGVECHRCGSSKLEDEECPNCIEKCEGELEQAETEIKEVKELLSTTSAWDIEERIEELTDAIEEKRIEEAYDLLEWINHDLAKIQEFHDIFEEIEDRLEEDRVFVNRSVYEKKIELMIQSLESSNFDRAISRASKVLDYLKEEKRYLEMDNSDFVETNIEDFSRKVIGLGPRLGETIYSKGYSTLKTVYEAGSKKLAAETEIKEEKAVELIEKLDSIFEEKNIELEKGSEEIVETEEETPETQEDEEDKEDKVEEIFKEEEEKEEEEDIEEKKEPKEESEDQVNSEKLLKVYRPDRIDNLEAELEFKYWIPAIVIPIVLALAAFLLFIY